MPLVDIKQILVPTDFSDFSTRALEHAVALAGWYKATVTAVHVYWVPQQPALAEYPAALIPTPKSRAEVQAALEKFLEPARAAGLKTDTVTLEGDPVRVILEEASSRGTDLIVLGTHGRSGFERFVLGSVTEKVLRKASCPVLTVPRPSREGAAGAALFKSILCPVDFSKPSVRALDYALSLAQEAQGRLTLLHVLEWIEDDSAFSTAHFNVSEYRRQLAAEAAERLAGIVPADAREWADLKEVVVLGRPWQRILEAVRENDAGLIVMGCAGRSAVDVMLFGSTTQHVVREASCPVLTLRT